jgi:5-methyltetrahydropteroyltriglutamate--homocysteine methyltransferase
VQLPTEPIGSIPRPPELVAAFGRHGEDVPEAYVAAVRDTLERFEATGVLGTRLADEVLAGS